jgi:peptidyl-tRNA hydrolase
MDQNKICPNCQSEYFPHIEKCADCGAVLLLPEEYRKAQEERKRTAEKALENMVVVREGSLDWMRELQAVLMDAGIPCAVHSDAGCKKGCCGTTCRLIVSSDDLERSREKIEEYYMEVSPEFCASNELLKEGKCPACGSPVGAGELECRDCGLPLLIVEEE